MRRALAAAALALSVLTGCGSDEDLSAAAERVLQADVKAVETAARAGNRAGLQSALARLRTHVEEQQAKGEVSQERAARILAAGARVALDVGLPRPAPVATPSRPPATGGDGEGDGKGDGKKGSGGDKGDDDKED